MFDRVVKKYRVRIEEIEARLVALEDRKQKAGDKTLCILPKAIQPVSIRNPHRAFEEIPIAQRALAKPSGNFLKDLLCLVGWCATD